MNYKKAKLILSLLNREISLYKLASAAGEFEKEIKDKTYTHPDTKNKVKFKSLPNETQKEIREKWRKKNDKLELSEEDKKLMEEFRSLDLDEEEIFELFSTLSDKTDKVTEKDLKELEGMDAKELEGQVEGLLKQNDSEDDDWMKDFEEALERVNPGVAEKEKKEKEEKGDKGKKKLDKEVRDDAIHGLEDFIGSFVDTKEAKKGLEDFYDYVDQYDRLNLDGLNTLLDQVKEVSGKAREEFKKKFNEYVEDFGEEEAKEMFAESTGLSPKDLDNDEAIHELLEIDEFVGDIKSEVEKKEKAKEKAELAEKAKEEKKKKREEQKKREEEAKKKREENKIKKNKDNRASANNDKIHRENARKKIEKNLDEAANDLLDTDYYFDDRVAIINEAFSSLIEDYGIQNLDDIKDLNDEALDGLISTIEETSDALAKKRNEVLRGKKIERARMKRNLSDKRKELEDVISKQDELAKQIKKKGISKEKMDELKEQLYSLEDTEYRLQEEVSDLEYDVEQGKVNAKEMDGEELMLVYDTSFGDSLSPNELLAKAFQAKGDKKKQKELAEAQKKEEEEHKQKVKEYTKKIGDLISSANSAKDSKEVSELWGELGRIKGQLSEGKVFDEVKGDLDKAEKALKDAQENNTLSSKLKSFFGLGKGKKKAQYKAAKIALEILKEEISLYKEEEARRNKRR